MTELIEKAKAFGFSEAFYLDPAAIVLHDSVREACSADTCRSYDRCWSCPPHCGELSYWREKIGAFERALLVQTVVCLEDEFDYEGMMQGLDRHSKNFYAFRELLPQNTLALGAGPCRVCKRCSFPEACVASPVSSMEAVGMLVAEVCSACGAVYNHGKNTVTYVGCYLLT